jgi:hypothetical protein
MPRIKRTCLYVGDESTLKMRPRRRIHPRRSNKYGYMLEIADVETPVLTGQPSSPVSHVHEQSTHWRNGLVRANGGDCQGRRQPEELV